MPHARGPVMGMPTLRMGQREPAEEFGHLGILSLLGPDRKMPVIAHHNVAQNAQRNALKGFGDDLLESSTVDRLAEKPRPSRGSMEHVVHVTANKGPGASGHASSLA